MAEEIVRLTTCSACGLTTYSRAAREGGYEVARGWREIRPMLCTSINLCPECSERWAKMYTEFLKEKAHTNDGKIVTSEYNKKEDTQK